MPVSVYVFRRVVDQILAFCRAKAPDEALGVLVGRRCQHGGRRYVRVVDWATGAVDASPSHARFTAQGVAECYSEVDEKYGAERARTRVVGVFHSHPFGGEPRLSSVDVATFQGFPYATAGSVFVLVSPSTGHFLVFTRSAEGRLIERVWMAYEPRAPSDE